MNYKQLLKEAPPHDSKEFITYLTVNNRVRFMSNEWLVIYNFKYHNKRRRLFGKKQVWLTAFWTGEGDFPIDFTPLNNRFKDWTWLKKPKNKQTVNRFHIHMYQDHE